MTQTHSPAWAALVAAMLLLFSAMPASAASPAGGSALSRFTRDAELRRFLRPLWENESAEAIPAPTVFSPPPPPVMAPLPTPNPMVSAPELSDRSVTATLARTPGVSTTRFAGAPSITNNQVANVDEGDIVKLRGDILVILRRGRLFTVSLAGGGMRPVASIDAFPPGVDGSGDWYDEMLVSGDRVVVIGYSYDRNGTQVNRFRLAADGRLRFEDSYQLRSSDYYSSENYATRLIGNRLVLYAPLDLYGETEDPLDALPAMTRWRAGNAAPPLRRIAPARNVFIPRVLRRTREPRIDTLHSVTNCDLTAPVLDCRATVVLGTEARVFFVSANAVYLWLENVWGEDDGDRARPGMLYRIPLDLGRPSAVGVRGGPVDQFSFRADPARNLLHVLVREEGDGDGMWAATQSSGGAALLTLPMTAFGDGSHEARRERYQALPVPQAPLAFTNRFVGDHLLWGYSKANRATSVGAISLATRRTDEVPLGHGVSRIDAIGSDAIAIGPGDGALGFTAIELSPERVRAGSVFRLPDAQEGETRSHAFFYRPDPAAAAGESGLMGLPVARVVGGAEGRAAGRSAAMLFLRRQDRALREAGELAASGVAGRDRDDGCVASCVDWYGNARPIFVGERVFALLGYELVEGDARGERIREVGRTDFSPAPLQPRQAN